MNKQANIDEVMQIVFQFMSEKGWHKSFQDHNDSWKRKCGESDPGCVRQALFDWLDDQKGAYLKAPLPGDVRPYYIARIEKKRMAERMAKSGHVMLTPDQLQHIPDFSKLPVEQVQHTAKLIMHLRSTRPNKPGYDEAGRIIPEGSSQGAELPIVPALLGYAYSEGLMG